MKLNYREMPSNLGGAALSNCGTIYIDEVSSTLDQLTQDIEYPVNLNNRTVGSTGKKTYSGDIDLVLDPQDGYLFIDDLWRFLKERFGQDNVRKLGKLICLRYPISGYDSSHNELGPRTGYVQVDFNVGNYDWESFFYFSAGNNSSYKSAQRNIAISAVSSIIDRKQSTELDNHSRPLEVVRWKWSIYGFSKIIRKSKPRDDGNGYARKQEDTIIDGPYYNKEFIVSKLFPVTSRISDLDSLESIIDAIKLNYPEDTQKAIFKKIADSLLEWDKNREFFYPVEIEEYFLGK